jgi:farnesyl diphosphate synthase
MGEVIDFDLRLKEVADKVTVALDQLIPPASGRRRT